MIHSELISTTVLNDRFHNFVEQISGYNTAAIVQSGKRPRSKLALPLAFYKAFSNPNANTSDVLSLFGMLHFGMLCAGPELDMSEVAAWPHGLRCLQNTPTRHGAVAMLMTGDGNQWTSAIHGANLSDRPPVLEWSNSCKRQFEKHDLNEFLV